MKAQNRMVGDSFLLSTSGLLLVRDVTGDFWTPVIKYSIIVSEYLDRFLGLFIPKKIPVYGD